METDSRKRFSNRVDDYTKYRPGYPDEVLTFLSEKGLSAESTVADIGSGTGLFTRLLLPAAQRVYAIEPNREMRESAERELKEYSSLLSLSTSAEQTSLPDASVDFITSAQAFHWFDPVTCRAEFSRVLRPGGRIFLIWNRRDMSVEFMKAYEQLLVNTLGERYTSVHHHRISEETLSGFFGKTPEKRVFPYHQNFNLEGFLGRVFSSSYTPSPEEGGYTSFRKSLEQLFSKYERNGEVSFSYQCEVFTGVMTR